MIKFFQSIDYRARCEVIKTLGPQLLCKISDEDLKFFTQRAKQRLLDEERVINDPQWEGYYHG